MGGLLAALERRGPVALEEVDVVAAAGTSAATFRRHFSDLDECFDFACEAGLDLLLGPMVAAWSVPRSPGERLDAALAALLGALEAQPSLAELCLLHSPVRQRDRRTYRRLVDSLAELLLDCRCRGGMGRSRPSADGERLLAHGAVGLIAARLADGGPGLAEVRPQLVGLLVTALQLDSD